VMDYPAVRRWIDSARQEPVIARYEFD